MKKTILFIFLWAIIRPSYSQWVQLTNDFDFVASIIAYDSTVIAGAGPEGDFDLAVSGDAGATWTGFNPFPASNGVSYLAESNNWIYACTPNGLYRSEKASLNWSPFYQGLPFSVFKIIGHDSILLAIDENTLYLRNIEDSAWSVLSDNIPQEYITDFDFDGNRIAIAGYDGACESSDMGVTWTAWSDDFALGAVVIKGDTMIHASPGGVCRKLISTGQIANVSDGLAKLWTPPPGWDYYGTFEQFHKIGDDIFLCGETGVYLLTGNNWHWEYLGLSGWVYDLDDNGETLFAVNGYIGIYARQLDQIIVNINETHRSTDPVNVYPNPVSDILTVRSAETLSCITLCDNTGKILLQTDQEGSNVRLDMQNYSPGVYYLHIKTKTGYFVRKVLVI